MLTLVHGQVALETAGTGVTANCICPGWVLTPLVQAQIDAKAKEMGVRAATLVGTPQFLFMVEQRAQPRLSASIVWLYRSMRWRHHLLYCGAAQWRHPWGCCG